MLTDTTTSTHFFGAKLSRAVLLIFLFMSMGSFAQVYSSHSPFRPVEQRQIDPAFQQEAPTYRAYQSTVYEPFSTTTPSESGNNSGGSMGISVRKNLTGVGDPNAGTLQSPIGEPWVLLLFAAVAAVVVRLRNKEQGISKG